MGHRVGPVRERALAGLALLVVSLLPAPPARASILLARELSDLVRDAHQIAVVTVVSVRSQWDEERRRITSTIDLDVIERWKGGDDLPRRVTVVQPGGTVDGIHMVVMGLGEFAVGERSLVFLSGASNRARVVGMSQGKRSLRFDEARRTWRVAPMDLRNARLVRPGEASGEATPPVAGGAAATPPVWRGDVPLDELRSEVLRLVAAGKTQNLQSPQPRQPAQPRQMPRTPTAPRTPTTPTSD